MHPIKCPILKDTVAMTGKLQVYSKIEIASQNVSMI